MSHNGPIKQFGFPDSPPPPPLFPSISIAAFSNFFDRVPGAHLDASVCKCAYVCMCVILGSEDKAREEEVSVDVDEERGGYY